MKSSKKFFEWAFDTRAQTVIKLYEGERMPMEKMFLSFCSHEPAFVSYGPAGLNASVKGVGFLPKDEYLEETLAVYLKHIETYDPEDKTYSQRGLGILIEQMYGEQARDRIDFTKLGSLELAKKQSWENYQVKLLSGISGFIGRIWSDKQGRVGLIIVIFLAVVAIFAPLIAPYDPYDVTMRDDKGLAPSLSHLLGTSITTGQDVFSMLIYGTRVSLCVGLITGISIAFLGCILGVAAGYLGGIVDMILMRIVDVMIVIPTLPLTILITNVFGKSYVVIVLVFVLFGWTGLARTVRSLVLQLKNADYVKAAELSGASKWYIMIHHILPGVSHLVVMSTALTCAGIMIAEAGLSFLGLGNPTAISWGKMLADAQSGGSMLFGQWWTILAPGIGIPVRRQRIRMHHRRRPDEGDRLSLEDDGPGQMPFVRQRERQKAIYNGA